MNTKYFKTGKLEVVDSEAYYDEFSFPEISHHPRSDYGNDNSLFAEILRDLEDAENFTEYTPAEVLKFIELALAQYRDMVSLLTHEELIEQLNNQFNGGYYKGWNEDGTEIPSVDRIYVERTKDWSVLKPKQLTSRVERAIKENLENIWGILNWKGQWDTLYNQAKELVTDHYLGAESKIYLLDCYKHGGVHYSLTSNSGCRWDTSRGAAILDTREWGEGCDIKAYLEEFNNYANGSAWGWEFTPIGEDEVEESCYGHYGGEDETMVEGMYGMGLKDEPEITAAEYQGLEDEMLKAEFLALPEISKDQIAAEVTSETRSLMQSLIAHSKTTRSILNSDE
jgi:hypothetical protein